MVAHGLIDAATVDVIESSRAGTGLRFLSAATRGALIDEQTALSALATHAGVPGIDLTRVTIPSAVLQRIPMSVAQREGIIPIRVEGPSLVVAMIAPNDQRVRDEVSFVTGLSVIAYVALQMRVQEAVTAAYRNVQVAYKGPMARGAGEPLPIVTPLATEPAAVIEVDDVLKPRPATSSKSRSPPWRRSQARPVRSRPASASSWSRTIRTSSASSSTRCARSVVT